MVPSAICMPVERCSGYRRSCGSVAHSKNTSINCGTAAFARRLFRSTHWWLFRLDDKGCRWSAGGVTSWPLLPTVRTRCRSAASMTAGDFEPAGRDRAWVDLNLRRWDCSFAGATPDGSSVCPGRAAATPDRPPCLFLPLRVGCGGVRFQACSTRKPSQSPEIRLMPQGSLSIRGSRMKSVASRMTFRRVEPVIRAHVSGP